MSLVGSVSVVWLALLPAVAASDTVEAPWQRSGLDFETGFLSQIRNSTLNYEFLVTQASWRSPAAYEFHFENESVFAVRSRVSLIGTSILEGPENHYFGFSAAPSLEWWAPGRDWSVYFSVGGGAGFIDSTSVVGGQGQDFTFNWFANLGLRYQWSNDFSVHGGVLFQHLSNAGLTDPNPGLDVLGFSVGAGFSF